MSAHQNGLPPWIEHLERECVERSSSDERPTSNFYEHSRRLSNDGIFILVGKCMANISVNEYAVWTKHNVSAADLNA